ncbi:lipopolysaccharide biosynthesis protein [Cellulomonas marina]|uniref:Membrane protein involved in the export of O-antigen and teichoic acid n=1 Tax=Cellulomonas marina TaxID=988821 RepID=A0A1I0X6Y9_9CELL|nr:lipopolysaccharide biosynthesis protein [Cellulomonas marina]GIG28937.1 hypothetical protein Cma02nite_15370 [Cellulomonas marina]SFA95793.1 Membrane protein involved in the export of O-antigen and teichoic acid [Cellulomonas marina]
MKRQFLVLLVSRGLASVLQAVLFAVLARSVSAHDFGLVTALQGILAVVLVLTGLGMPGLVSRARARGEDATVAGALRLTWTTGLVTVVLTAGVLAVAAALGALPLALVLVAATLTVERTTDAALNVPVADGEVTSSGLPVVLRRALAIALLLPATAWGADPLWAYGAAGLVGALAAQLWTQRLVRVEAPGRTPVRALVAEGAPYMWNTAAAQTRQLDVTVVAAVLSPGAAGAYAAASKLVAPALLVPQTIASLVLPRASRGTAHQARRLVRPLLLAGAASLVVVVPLALLAEPVVTLVMGERYAGSAGTFRWLLVGMPFAALSAPLAAVLQGQGRAREAATNGLLFAVVLLGGVAAGAVLAGGEGAAIGLSLSFVVRTVALLAQIRRGPADGARPGVTGDGTPPAT